MMSDRWGRRHNITLLAILFFFGAIGNAISPNVWVMYIFRALLGFAVGGASATVPVYLAETAPKRIRGAIVAVDQLMIVTGQLLTFSINALIATMRGGPELTVTADPSGLLPAEYIGHAISFDTLALMQASRGGTLSTVEYHEFLTQLSVATGNGDTWRYMIILCSIPAIALWIGIRLMPESSRWYVAKDRLYEAIGALKRVRNEAVDGPLVEELADIATIHRAETSSERKGFGYVWRTPWLRRLMIVGIFLGTTNQLTGVNTVMYYAPKVLQYAGMDTSSAIVAQVANGVMSVVGSALGIWLILNFRRRQILIADVIGVGLSLLTIAAVFQFAIAPYMNAQQTPPAWAAYAVLGLMAMFMLIVQPSNGTIVWTMMGELFPNNVRGVMNGTAIFCLWIVNAIVGWTFPVMIEGLGGGLTYTIYGIVNLVVAVVLFRVMPETSGKSLEEIETEMEKRFS